MSIDKSLKRRGRLRRARNVLTRAERIRILEDEGRWQEGESPFGLATVRVRRVRAKKRPKEEAPAEAAPAGEEAAGESKE